jgi:predicted nucleotidyltransferase
MRNLAQREKVLGPHIKRILLDCARAIRANYPSATIVLYGSQARGQADPESDVDLLVLLNEDVTPAKKRTVRGTLYEIGLMKDLVITAIVRSYKAWNSPISQATPLYKVIQQEGIQVP